MSQFCDQCGVTIDLHDHEDDCVEAEHRADRVDHITRLFFAGVMNA